MDVDNENVNDDDTADGIQLPNMSVKIMSEKIPILEADTVYLLMKENIPISRVSRVEWLLRKLNTYITFPSDTNNRTLEDDEFNILSIIPTELYHDRSENNKCFKYLVTENTKIKFLADNYRIVYCLDMSPSQSAVDIQCGEILFDEILKSFKSSIEGLSRPFTVPCSGVILQPKIYLTVIAHTPFFMTPAQQVLLKGIMISPSNLEEIFSLVEKRLKILEERICDVSGVAQDQIEEQAADSDKLVDGLFEEDQIDAETILNIPMVSPDANFVNMLRYSMLALSLLPDNSLSNIILITDGVVALPDVNIMESLLMQLHYDSTAVSFIKIGSPFHPHVCAGYVPYTDILRFLSHSTMGSYLENLPEISSSNSCQLNEFHKAYLIWTFQTISEVDVKNSVLDTAQWTTTNKYFYGQKVPTLLRKKQIDDKINTSLFLLLSRRIRAGFTIDKIHLENDLLQIELSLPWKNFIYLQYAMTASWPPSHAVVYYSVHVAAPYEFLHDITCLMKKELKSSFRQAVVERFWCVLTHLASGDTSLAQHMYTFHNSTAWFTLPESVKNKMSTFIMINNTPVDITKPQFVASDMTCPKFGSIWQPVCQLENSQWNKWFHAHKISLIVRHDDPVTKNLHLANSSGRFQMVQCRQSAVILNSKLTDWSSFTLIENHSFVKFLYKDSDKPIWFCIIRVISKLPCAVIKIGFINGTPGYLRRKVCEELKKELTHLSLPSHKQKESACILLNKPLEKILIRYERMPSDFNTVVFPDGTQPPNPHQVLQPPPLFGALFTTLSRYLYHKRWVWNATYMNNPKLGISSIAQILNTITKMRIKEGFSFAHSSAGIINMVLEVEMSPSNNSDDTVTCVIQYVIFPPHCLSRCEYKELGSGSEDETDIEQESDIELQMITEVWIEPQYGEVKNSPPARHYMELETYYKLADKIGSADSECINSLLTLEHLSLMCQTKSCKREEKQSDVCITNQNKVKFSKNKKERNRMHMPYNVGYFGNHEFMHHTYEKELTPLIDERIHHIPFKFNLNNILSICQQTELLFSMFIEDDSGYINDPYEKPNNILLETFHEHLQLLHDSELSIGAEDSRYFLDLLNFKHSKNPNKHLCPLQHILDSGVDDNSQPKNYSKCPQWRCFIKGISITHVILTFVPYDVEDLRMLISQNQDNQYTQLITQDSQSEDSNVNMSSTDSVDDQSERSSSMFKQDSSLILPVYVYDCPLAVLINYYIHGGKNKYENVLKDVYEDHTYKSTLTFEEYLQKKRPLFQRSPEPKNEDSDTDDINSSIRQHCKTLTLVHSKCFVVSLFRSLRFQIPIDNADVQSAIDQCEEIVDEIDITEYLQTICGHLKFNKDKEINVHSYFQGIQCVELEPLHKLIQEKFMKITKIAFQPVPSHTEFYFCSPCMPRDNMTNVDEDSDDEMSSAPSEIIFKSDQESIVSIEDNNQPYTRNDIDIENATNDIVESDEISPLFLQLMCTVRIQNMVYSVPVKVLPTCLGEVLTNINYNKDTLNLSTVRITLDIICLTLPPNVQSVITESAFTGLRTTSFCSGSPSQIVSTGSELSLASDDHGDTMYSLNHLPEFQQTTIKIFKEEVKWLLRDEIATALLDFEPISTDTLNMVINHVESSVYKMSCKKDIISLNFVYGATHSRNKFLKEFRKLTVNMKNNVKYKLCEDGDIYYLVKNNSMNDQDLLSNVSTVNSDKISFKSYDDNYPEDGASNNCFLIDEQPEISTEQEQLNDIASNASNSKDFQRSDQGSEKVKFYQHSNDSSIMMSSTEDVKTFDDELSDEDEEFEWLNYIDNKRTILPNFWLILRLEQDIVTIYFHCRFLEFKTSKVTTFLNVHRNIVLAIKNLCKRVNQSVLLQYLHDTRMCDRLLEPEDDKKEIWHSDSTTPTITRNTSFVRMKSMEENLNEGVEFQQVAYLEAFLKFTPGFFRCNPVWETHFVLHPRLKTGPGKSGLSRGIQALRTVLNKFSVSNRSNMFVYQDSSSNVFYLRLHENVQSYTKLVSSRSKTELSNGQVSRSPSIASLPLGQQKQAYQSDCSNSGNEIRPRVRSIGEKERTENIVEDTIILKVHGITDAGPDVKCELVQVLQNRLDDAVLEILSMMLARNAMCPLTPADVQFLQKPFRPPEHIVRLSIPNHALDCLDAFIHYLRQNILQFLNMPKYTDPNSYNHFKDYSDSDQGNNLVKDDQIFLYNQSQNPSSGNRGIACVSLAVVCNTKNGEEIVDHNSMKLDKDATFENIVTTSVIEAEKDDLPKVYLEFRIWKQGRVNLDALIVKLKSAVSQGMWDLVNEYYFLRVPLCFEEKKQTETSEYNTFNSVIEDVTECIPTADVQLLKACKIKSTISQKMKKLVPNMSKVSRKLLATNPAYLNLPNSTSASFNSVDNSLKNSNSSLSYTETTSSSIQNITRENLSKLTTNVVLNKFEKGEKGYIHDLYSSVLIKWFEYAIELNVPAVKKCYVPLSNRHTVNICVRELQHIVSSIAPDTAVKAFDLQFCQYSPIKNRNIEVYVPYNPSQISLKILLIGRNFEQWKISTYSDINMDYISWIETSLLKHYQKFPPHVVTNENKFIPRQRLFLGLIVCDELTFYVYNWSKDRVDKLFSQCQNLGMWLCARASLLSSIVAQKKGLFHNQLTLRKTKQIANNPYLNYMCESLEHLHRFPSGSSILGKDWINRKSQTGMTVHETIAGIFRDAKPVIIVTKKSDRIWSYTQEITAIKQKSRQQQIIAEERKKMHAIWQSRGSSRNFLQTQMLQKHARTIHYCHTPLLFLPRWRIMSAATRDHSLNVEFLDDVINISNPSENSENQNIVESWHEDLCLCFIREYKQYLQTLGFVPLEINEKRDRSAKTLNTIQNIYYVQKPVLGGIMIFTIELNEPFFTVKLHAIECCRLQQKISRNLFNQFTLSFLDECDRIKSLMHLHSFTYDFHLRCIHSYTGCNAEVKIGVDYHLTKFLDDFNKYYPKTPNFARNVVSSEIIIIKDLLTEGQQLYTYLLSNNKQYGMHVLSMKKKDIPEETDNDYVLIQVTSIPQVMYKDSQDRQQTDDFNVTLIVTNLGIHRVPQENMLRLKFYIVVTSRREIYPKSDVEKTLGKFRTVSSTEPNPIGIGNSEVQESCENIVVYKNELFENADELIYSSNQELELEGSQKVDSSVFSSSTNLNESEGEDILKTKIPNVVIKQESVNYLGYYSSHEQLMQKLMVDQATIARQKIRTMVSQGMVHCRTHLLWNKLVSHQDSNHLIYDEFLELRGLAKLENLIDFHPDLKILLDHPFSWYQSLTKLLTAKYNDHHRLYTSPDNNIQHLVILHPRYIGTFMMVSIDLHMSRGDLYVASREPPQFDTCEMSSLDRKELINGFINCVAAHVWSGIVQS